jgi:hypothetical protein
MKVNKLITSLSLLFLAATPAYAQIVNPAIERAVGPDSGGEGLAFYLGQIWRALVVAGGIAFLIYFLMGGLEWITAGGDKDKISGAQKKITGGLVGLALLVTSFALISLIGTFFGIDLLNIDWTFGNAN